MWVISISCFTARPLTLSAYFDTPHSKVQWQQVTQQIPDPHAFNHQSSLTGPKTIHLITEVKTVYGTYMQQKPAAFQMNNNTGCQAGQRSGGPVSGSSASESDSEELPLLVPPSPPSSLSQSLLLSWSSSPPYKRLYFRINRVSRGFISPEPHYGNLSALAIKGFQVALEGPLLLI